MCIMLCFYLDTWRLRTTSFALEVYSIFELYIGEQDKSSTCLPRVLAQYRYWVFCISIEPSLACFASLANRTAIDFSIRFYNVVCSSQSELTSSLARKFPASVTLFKCGCSLRRRGKGTSTAIGGEALPLTSLPPISNLIVMPLLEYLLGVL